MNRSSRSDARNFLKNSEPVSAQISRMVPIRELRRSGAGKAELYATGRDGKETERRPGASLHRKFVAWDGEGITYVEGKPQSYVLFGNSSGMYIQGRSLSTFECLRLMIQTEIADPNVFHVGFAFNYDVNMILRDVPRERLKRLRKAGHIKWNGFRIEWRPSKWFQVTRQVEDKKYTCRIWDVWGFFQGSFVKALRDYLGDRKEFDEIEKGKAHRGDFSEEEIESVIKPYWESELHYLVLLVDRLRAYLYSAGLDITQWHGPGAIASLALRKHGMSQYMKKCPQEVNDAAQYAYAGGRFELFKLGRYLGDVYQYDINSAYPEGISLLPSLSRGEWVRVREFDSRQRFGIYRVRLRAPLAQTPYPLFYRDKRHCIHYPAYVEGWYWAPEVANIAKWGCVEIVEGWVFDDDGTYPFDWVRDVYGQRREWKRAGNPCEKALKLLLNSLYGKMAQRVGWNQEKMLPPKWHQLEWAGWVTSYARAKLYRAMVNAGQSLIAVETDAVFSSKPLELECGTGLGQWDLNEYDEIVYLQSGFRFMRKEDMWSTKFRGFDKESIRLDDVMTYLKNVELSDVNRETGFAGTTTRFIGMGLAFMSKTPEIWRTWMTEPRILKMGVDGKRVHIPPFCHACKDGVSAYSGFHTLAVAKPGGGQSVAHHLPWKNDISPWQEQFEQVKEMEAEQR